jgi:hypothetical protein
MARWFAANFASLRSSTGSASRSSHFAKSPAGGAPCVCAGRSGPPHDRKQVPRLRMTVLRTINAALGMPMYQRDGAPSVRLGEETTGAPTDGAILRPGRR